ncbi:MAG: sirohydrochlorin cobaltochelatase [Syntrophomonadaceae bacterium]|nr:sirohydrochlorin cobaltochelatase [Syntrophomonadaceae bacterium]
MGKINKKKKAILVVSFGTSHAATRAGTIGAIEKDVAAAYPEYEVRRAFTSQKVIDILAHRDGIRVDNVREAMNRLLEEGFREVIVQPTHIIKGIMNDEMMAVVEGFTDKFVKIEMGQPLLGRTEDYQNVTKAIMDQFTDMENNEALILMGHGTGHQVNAVYTALERQFKQRGHAHVFVGTVEAYPDIEAVMNKIELYDFQKITLMPLMIVAGDHVIHDMAGEEDDSWKNLLAGAGYEVTCILKGLGEIQAIRDIFLDHIAAARLKPGDDRRLYQAPVKKASSVI